MLEYWDKFIMLLQLNDEKDILIKSEMFKFDINNYVRNKKINIKNINKFFRNNIADITESEIKNANISIEYLNSFIL